ncbi:VCBS repeat-containing protein [Persicitalea sp.]|uniref:VCBS repeat-containing protein n=1 Tax=Persicitalea sp. TaxID=3100273 RepID=UPI0035948CC8
MRNQYLFGLSLGCVILAAGFDGCTSREKLFKKLPASQTGITFENRLTESDSLNALTFEYIYNGAGVGVGDFNRDGWPDLYFAGNQVSSGLFLNKTQAGGGMRFEDITRQSGTGTTDWCTGVSVADVNQDGWPDIYVCVAGLAPRGSNKLFINNGPTPDSIPTFTERAAEYGLDDSGYSTQAVFFDYDRDGYLDCYLLTNALEPTNRNALRAKFTQGEAPSNDRLFRNDGMRFENVAPQTGILTEGYGLGVCLSDLDDNGWPDLYCANDFLSNDLIWMNGVQPGDASQRMFTNQATTFTKHQTHNGMGVDIADINNDALPDIVVVDMLPADNYRQKMMLPGSNYNRFQMEAELDYQPQFMRNTLQLNRGSATRGVAFSEIGQLAGIEKTDWSWAPLLADFDNDGWKDLYITNGYRRDVTNLDFIAYSQANAVFGTPQAQFRQVSQELYALDEISVPKYAFRNQGSNPAAALTFEDVSETWRLDQIGFSNGAAYADLDNDGDLDLVTNNIDSESFILENQLNQRPDAPHWLRLLIEPAPGLPVVVGTKVWLYAGGQQQMLELAPVRGFVSTVENALHFGLGSVSRYDSLVIRYPNGLRQSIGPGAVDQLIKIAYRPGGPWRESPAQGTSLFTQLSEAESRLSVIHQESRVVDFNRTPLLPHLYSKNGPYLAVGDVDGDHLDDFFVGTDFGHLSAVYIQQPGGNFQLQSLPGSDAYEDMNAVFFDADADHDLDLYVVSGGSREEGLGAAYQDRLYLNDGKGNFKPAPVGSLPTTRSSGGPVCMADFDGDGDMDLFRGGRIVPGQYPKPADSYLLRNEGAGRFSDVTDQLAPGLREVGLVTAALWTDMDKDNFPDLMLVGEWMAPTLFRNEGGRLRAQETLGLAQETGWWCSLAAGDFDGDGDTDFVAGNLGLNSKFRASATEPVRVFANDYDQNGRLDPILTFYLNYEQVPVAPRDLLMAQIPSIKKRFPTYQDYAAHPFEELFTEEERGQAFVLEARQLASCYLENRGNFAFVVHPMPIEAQMAPVNGLIVRDFTGDGKADLLLAGNFYGTETLGGQLDAGKGLLLANVGSTNGPTPFRPLRNAGLNMDGDVKSIAPLRRPDGAVWWLVSVNSGPLQVWQQNNHPKPLLTFLK